MRLSLVALVAALLAAHPSAGGGVKPAAHLKMGLVNIKSLYSDSYFPRAQFESLYGGDAYRQLKAKYDPGDAFPGLYEKCVLKA